MQYALVLCILLGGFFSFRFLKFGRQKEIDKYEEV